MDAGCAHHRELSILEDESAANLDATKAMEGHASAVQVINVPHSG